MKLNKSILSAAVLMAVAIQANAAQVFTTDVIIQGSECVGVDCSSSESFSFDTIRLKENNLRIHFDDTSGSASFPKNDWRIKINDSSNGGAEYFAVEDATAGNTPFKIEAGAGNNALYVDDAGNIGVGTSTPVVEMHIADGDSPTLRLEQNGSSGFTSQTWDIAGNETNFFVRDVTNGSELPFKILPGADDDSIVIDANSEVGIGTKSPDAKLHVIGKVLAGPTDAGAPTSTSTIHAYGSDGNTKLSVEETNTTATERELFNLTNNGGLWVTMKNSSSGKAWYMTHQNDTQFNITHDDTGGQALLLSTAGNMTIKGTLTTGGTTCGGGCDLVFEKNYSIDSIEEHSSSMWENKYLPTVGPTKENQPFNITEKTGRMLNELEKAHIFIDLLNTKLKEKDNEIVALKSEMQVVSDKYASLEERLLNLEQN